MKNNLWSFVTGAALALASVSLPSAAVAQEIANPTFFYGISRNAVGGQAFCKGSSSLAEANLVVEEMQVLAIAPAPRHFEWIPSTQNLVVEYGKSSEDCWQFARARFLQDRQK